MDAVKDVTKTDDIKDILNRFAELETRLIKAINDFESQTNRLRDQVAIVRLASASLKGDAPMIEQALAAMELVQKNLSEPV